MKLRDSDKEWERWGQLDPYYGVRSEQRFRKASLNGEVLDEFFSSGTRIINTIIGQVRSHIWRDFKPTRALDFGCGVGRLTIPLAQIADEVVGVDVSSSMLQEAQRNSIAQSVHNIVFQKSDDDLSAVLEPFDFVISYIVLQHIPVGRGTRIFQRLLDLVSPGGVIALHVTFWNPSLEHDKDQVLENMEEIGRVSESSENPSSETVPPDADESQEPQMQMNEYDLNRIFFMLQQSSVTETHVEVINHGVSGLLIYGRKHVK